MDTTSTTSEHVDGGEVRDAVSHAESPSHADLASTESKITSAATHEQPASVHGQDSADAPAHVDHTNQVDASHAATAGTAAATAVATHPGSVRTGSVPPRLDASTTPAAGAHDGSAGHGGDGSVDHGGDGSVGQAATGRGGPNYPEARVTPESTSYRSSLDAAIAREGLSQTEFKHLVSQNLTDLTSADIERIGRIRTDVGTPTTHSVIQKLLTPGVVRDIFAHTGNGGRFDISQNGVSGFIAELAQASHVGTGQPATPRSLFRMFGLGFSGTEFDGTGRSSMFSIRFETTSTNGVTPKDMPFRDAETWFKQGDQNSLRGIDRTVWDNATPAQREDLYRQAMQSRSYTKWELSDVNGALDRNNPFRGNGWAGHSGSYAPEVLGRELPVKDGAEIWRYNPDGTQDVVARYDEATKSWRMNP
ncbi:MAG: hypothetical protein AAGC90_07840 [Curtobacterium sp.]